MQIPVFRIACLLCAATLTACAYSPLEGITIAADAVGLTNKIDVNRQRYFTIPKNSRVGVIVADVISDADYEEELRSLFTRAGTHSFQNTFYSVALVNENLPANYDFLVSANLLGVDHYSGQPENSDAAHQLESQPVQTKRHPYKSGFNKKKNPVSKQYRARLKLVLIDARNDEVLDVARVHAVAGAFGNKDFADFLQQSVHAYVNTLTTDSYRVTY